MGTNTIHICAKHEARKIFLSLHFVLHLFVHMYLVRTCESACTVGCRYLTTRGQFGSNNEQWLSVFQIS